MITKKLFLASSAELSDDRTEFEIFVNRKNNDWVEKGVFLRLILWEDFLDVVSRTRLQDEYNKAIRECDVFVMLFFSKVGKYTEEEFETAFGQFQATNRPFILTYFKDAENSKRSTGDADSVSLRDFQEKLDALGHFYTRYTNIDQLKLHFSRQLDKLVESGFIEFKPNADESTSPGSTTYTASLPGNGAIAQGAGTAVGARGVSVGGKNTGNINTGTQTNIDTGGGDALGEGSVKVEGNPDTIVTGTQIVNIYQATADGRRSKEQIARNLSGYLRWLRSRTESIELRGIERAGGAPVVLLPLETAYVPLRARSIPRVGEGEDKRPFLQDRMPRERNQEAGDAYPGAHDGEVELNQVLGLGNRLVIVGGPGSGKTTVLLHMAWALASSLMDGETETASSRLGLTIAPIRLPLPIFVPLASFARHRRNLTASAPAEEKTLAYFISHHLISKEADFDLPADFFVRLIRDERYVVLLLDGLDEVANENERAEVRQSIEELVSGREDLRVVVTCRTVAYRSGRTALGADFREIDVQPLDFERHIAPMVYQAYTCIYRQDTALREDRVKDLLDAIRRLEDERRIHLGDDTEALVDSPLMVRLLLIVHVNNRKLPDERADLFDKSINALLQVDYGHEESDIQELSRDWKLYRDMAQHLAIYMHEQGPDQGREIEEPDLKATLRREAEFEPRIDDFLSDARQRGSVLEERDGVYRFIHLAFQEFLVARYLREVTGSESRQALLGFLNSRMEDPWWREPILLLAGYWAGNAAAAARTFLGALSEAGETANERFSAAELACAAALEWPECGEALRDSCTRRVVSLLADTTALNNSAPVIRARAGDALARLGDPRFDQQRFYLSADGNLGFARIPADPEFRIGTRTSDVKRVADIIGTYVPDGEINDTVTPTREFYIAHYPVTVAQFRTFVEATGFPLGDTDALRDPDSRPVRYVSWHAALAYCGWLNEVLADPQLLDDIEMARLVREHGWRVALPSELEWEKAARGGLRHAVFSWGDAPDGNRANDSESEISDTSVVGCFPCNGFGLYDMIGNVWDWTRSLWGTRNEGSGLE